MKITRRAMALWVAPFLLSGCRLWEFSESDITGLHVVEITKWYEGRISALSVTLDGRAADFQTENNWLIERGLTIDYEVVSAMYDADTMGLDYLKDGPIAKGFGYFGHGHAHDNHDTMTYAEAYASFSINHARMKAYGLTPISYAYPFGAGYQETTVQALKDAGFYAGRMAAFKSEEPFEPYIMRGGRREPFDWYRLPALYMESRDYQGCGDCIHDHDAFRPYVEESMRQTSWMITMYHAIGWDGETEGRPLAWGFYRRAEFYRDMEYAKGLSDAGTLWLASMDDVTRYTRQRVAIQPRVTDAGDDVYLLHLAHGLDSVIFNHEMTVRLEAPSRYIGKYLHVFRDEEDTPLRTMKLEGPGFLVNLPPSKTPYRLEFVDAPPL